MVGSRIRRRRIQLGMTQQDLADAMGFKSRSSINKIELNQTDVNQETLRKFTEVLNCDVLWLIGIEENEPRDELNELFDALCDDDRKEAIRYLTYLFETRTKSSWNYKPPKPRG